MSVGEIIIGSISLIAGLAIGAGGIYLHADTGAKQIGKVFPYILMWLLGIVPLVAGAIMVYDGSKSDGTVGYESGRPDIIDAQ